MKQIWTFILLCTVACLAGHAQPKAEFDKLKHEYGVVLWKTPSKATFKVKNTGDQPLVISNVTTSCGCTVADWTKTSIAPGASGEVSAVFDFRRASACIAMHLPAPSISRSVAR